MADVDDARVRRKAICLIIVAIDSYVTSLTCRLWENNEHPVTICCARCYKGAMRQIQNKVKDPSKVMPFLFQEPTL